MTKGEWWVQPTIQLLVFKLCPISVSSLYILLEWQKYFGLWASREEEVY